MKGAYFSFIYRGIFVAVLFILSGCTLLPFSKPQSTPLPTVEPTVVPTQTPTPTPEISQEQQELQEIANALAKLPEMNAGQLQLTLVFSDSSQAVGRYSHNYESVANNFWWLAKQNEGWEIVYQGKEMPKCALLSFVPDGLIGACP